MRTLLLVFLTIHCYGTFGQSYPPKRVLGSFIYDGTAYNYEFKSAAIDNYSFRITKPGQSIAQQPLKVDTAFISETKVKGDTITKKEVVEGEVNNLEKDSTKNVDEPVDKPDYIFSEFTKEIFQRVFINQMVSTLSPHRVTSINDLKDKSLEEFYKIKAKLDFIDDEPVTATLILRRDYVTSLLKYNSSPYYKGALSKLTTRHLVESVRIETEDGAIKNIIAHFVIPTTKIEDVSPRTYVEFKNPFPISISGKYDPEYFSLIRLYCLSCFGIEGLDRFIKLSDLLALDITLQNDKEDYSPVNSTIELNPSHNMAELKKEKRSRIVEVAAFTDFVGLDQEQPNGLIQFEAKRKINVRTKSFLLRKFETEKDIMNQLNVANLKEISTVLGKRSTTYTFSKPLGKNEQLPAVLPSKNLSVTLRIDTIKVEKKADSVSRTAIFKYKIGKRNFHSSYATFLNYIEPRLLFSKLEQNNRFIDSLGLERNEIDPVTLIQYQLVSFGMNANLLRFTFPHLKFTWNFLTVGGYWFRSRVGFSSDSTRTSIPLNNSYLLLSSEVVFRPDSRWGATIGVNYIKPSIWNASYQLSNDHAVIQPYFDGFLKTNETDKLFFRFRWSFEHKQRESNFTQIQLGYSVNLFANGNQGKPK